MKKYGMLFKAAMKKQKGSISGIILLTFILSLCLFSALILFTSGKAFAELEMDRLGFGDFTVWVSNEGDGLTEEIRNLPDVGEVRKQPLIFSGYEINGDYSDNEGQVIVYDGSVPYRFISENGTEQPISEIEEGTVYISPAMQSGFDVKEGDAIRFELSRSKGTVSLVVAGFFADGFMGSSMIDMKSFLVNSVDYGRMQDIISTAADVDVLGREGAMLHIFQSPDSMLEALDFNRLIQEKTDLSLYTEFAYRKESILDYMLLLQNILSGFLMAFSVVLLIICLVVNSHNLSAVMEQDKKDMAALKTLGLPGNGLRNVYLLLYGGIILLGLLLGLMPAFGLACVLAKGMVSSTGMLVSIRLPILLIFSLFIGIVPLFIVFLLLKTKRILDISPIQTLRDESASRHIHSALRMRFLEWDIALRELRSGKQKYTALCLVAIFLTFFFVGNRADGNMAWGKWRRPDGRIQRSGA